MCMSHPQSLKMKLEIGGGGGLICKVIQENQTKKYFIPSEMSLAWIQSVIPDKTDIKNEIIRSSYGTLSVFPALNTKEHSSWF